MGEEDVIANLLRQIDRAGLDFDAIERVESLDGVIGGCHAGKFHIKY